VSLENRGGASAAVAAPAAEFNVPTRIVSGWGCVGARLGDEVARLTTGVVAVVVDSGVVESGLLDTMLAHVEGATASIAGVIVGEPSLLAVEEAAQSARELGATAVLGVGGGSALSAAKAVAIRLTNTQLLVELEGRSGVPVEPAPSIAIPTTAGSGAEVSSSLVFHDPSRARNMVIRGPNCAPNVALLDGEMLKTLPQAPMIAAALDALSHALEALWARRQTPFTKTLAFAAADAVIDSLPPALAREPEAMQLLIEASAMANLACGNTGLALVHALSSAATVALPHGYQNGVLLPHVAAFNHRGVDEHVHALVVASSALYSEIGFQPRFAEGEVTAAVAEQMLKAAIESPFLANNVLLAGRDDLISILAQAGAR
jgi:alcohol dehydrogenase class IV